MASTLELCCAVSALLNLTNHNFNSTFGVDDVFSRCGVGCRGVGLGALILPSGKETIVPYGCSGTLSQPPLGVADCGSDASLKFLSEFRPNPLFRDGSSKECRTPVCPATYGATLRVRPKHKKRPIKVHAVPKPGEPDALHRTVVVFHKNHVPSKSDLRGPMTIKCTNHSSRLSVGAGTTLVNVAVNCSASCPVHVKLAHDHKDTHTKIINVTLTRHASASDVIAESQMCSTLITPVSNKKNPREFVGRGKVEVVSQYWHDIAVANINGELIVLNNNKRSKIKPMNITFLDSIEDSRGRLTITVSKNSGPVHLTNLTAVMHVFSQEYMVDFFGPSPRKEKEMTSLLRINCILAVVILALLAGDPDTISRAFPEVQPGSQTEKPL